MQIDQLSDIDSQLFFFVNPTSGGNRAQAFTDLKNHHFDLQLDNNKKVQINIFNLKEEKDRKDGIQLLINSQSNNKDKRVIVGGGDGTIMWVVELMMAGQVDIMKFPIGIVPFGTGNDFSRVLGWGGDSPSNLIGEKYQYLKKLVEQKIDGTIKDFDIWNIEVTANEGGCFRKISKDNQGFTKETLKQQNQQTQLKFQKKMCNYFSFGVDARIGYGFDKSRTNSAFCNKVVYCWEGFKKMFIKTPTINQILNNMEETVHTKDTQLLQGNDHEQINLQLPGSKQQIFGTAKGDPITLAEDAVNILALNIQSYSAGASDVWRECKGKIGLKEQDKTKKPITDNYAVQNYGDSSLEFVCFSSITSLANERFIKGFGKRIAQGPGPFVFNFKQQNSTPQYTYFQVDGEFYQVISPNSATIEWLRKIKVIERKLKNR